MKGLRQEKSHSNVKHKNAKLDLAISPFHPVPTTLSLGVAVEMLHGQTDHQRPRRAEGDVRADVQEVDGHDVLSGLESPASLLIRWLDGLVVQCGLGGGGDIQ